jgi:hypothetical protein
MTWDERIEKVQKVVDLMVKAEAHAICMVLLGAVLCLKGDKPNGQLIIGAGLAVFKGKS